MLTVALVLILIWVIVGIIGLVVKGLFWLTIVAGVLFLASLVLGGAGLRRRGPTR